MNFEFHNPTHLIFGAGALSRLGEAASRHGKKALIVTGGGSVKRNGTFDRAVASLKAAGMAFAECNGVEPNPRITTVRRGARIATGGRLRCDHRPGRRQHHGRSQGHGRRVLLRRRPLGHDLSRPARSACPDPRLAHHHRADPGGHRFRDEHGGGDFQRGDQGKILCPDRMPVSRRSRWWTPNSLSACRRIRPPMAFATSSPM